MSKFTVNLDVDGAFATPVECPECGSPGLRPVAEGDSVLLQCPGCRRSWESGFGGLTQVDLPSQRRPDQ